eukprot:scaffold323010_cov19-Prasinocladus_malaysianus.AAC.1
MVAWLDLPHLRNVNPSSTDDSGGALLVFKFSIDRLCVSWEQPLWLAVSQVAGDVFLSAK